MGSMRRKRRKKRRKQKRIPRRQLVNRAERLLLAPDWVKEYRSQKIVVSYANWFAVDLLCAIDELQMLGVEVCGEYRQKIIKREEEKLKREQKRNIKRAAKIREESWGQLHGCDDNFAFIAGFTSGGAAYGVSHEEMEQMEQMDKLEMEEKGIEKNRTVWENGLSDELPF